MLLREWLEYYASMPHPWISQLLGYGSWTTEKVLLPMFVSESANSSPSSAYSSHPVDPCTWCSMSQHWGFICFHFFLQDGKYQPVHNAHGIMWHFMKEDSRTNSITQLCFQRPQHVTLPCKAGNAETKASSVVPISKKTELMLPGKRNLSFLLNLLSAYLLCFSKLGWNIIKKGNWSSFIKSSQSTYFPGKDNPKRIDFG